MTTPRACSASASAAADLPLAVGPAISTASTLMGRSTVSFVLNVIAEDAAKLADEMRAFGEASWLAKGHAFDIAVTGDGAAALVQARAIAGTRAADINLVAAERRRKKLLIADMDSTIIGCECLDELADMAGLKPMVAALTERAMR